MKKLILTILFCASSAYAGLTGTQIKKVMAFADEAGFSYIGNQQIHQNLKGQSLTISVLVFFRVTDGDYALVDPSCLSLEDAINEFLGSKLMSEMYKEGEQSRKATPSSQ